uniref:Uncharacterized protein n=1 Tax=Aegilops tauschii TaxID=37682 RepID=N1R237_AEGTA
MGLDEDEGPPEDFEDELLHRAQEEETEDGDEACEEDEEDFAEEVVEDEEEEVVEDAAAESRLVVRQVSEGGDGPSRVTEHHEKEETGKDITYFEAWTIKRTKDDKDKDPLHPERDWISSKARGVVKNEVDAILLGSTAFCSRQRLGAMLANKESMATQLTDPSPLARVRVQVCLEDIKSSSLGISKGIIPGKRAHDTNKSFHHQQSTTTFN